MSKLPILLLALALFACKTEPAQPTPHSEVVGGAINQYAYPIGAAGGALTGSYPGPGVFLEAGVEAGVTGILPAGNGGTGLGTVTATGVMLGAGTAPVVPVTMAAGTLLVGQDAGTNPLPELASGDCTMTQAGVLTCTGLNTQNAAANLTVNGPIGALDGGALTYQAGSALAVDAAITLSSAQTAVPIFPLSGTMSANVNVTLPNIIGAQWLFDLSGVTFGGFTLIFTTGSGTTASITAVKAGGYKLIQCVISATHVVSCG